MKTRPEPAMGTPSKWALAVTLAVALAGPGLAGAQDRDPAQARATPDWVHRATAAMERGAQAAARGLERGAKAAEYGIRVGVLAAARGIERGAQAAARAAEAVARKVDPPAKPDPAPSQRSDA